MFVNVSINWVGMKCYIGHDQFQHFLRCSNVGIKMRDVCHSEYLVLSYVVGIFAHQITS